MSDEMYYEDEDEIGYRVDQSLKIDLLGNWIDSEWIPKQGNENLITLRNANTCVNQIVLSKFDMDLILNETHRFLSIEAIDSPVVVRINQYSYTDDGTISYRTGAFIYRFENVDDPDDITEALVVAAFYTNDGHTLCLVNIPEDFLTVWTAFSKECDRLMSPRQRVVVIGGNTRSFLPDVDWKDVILPDALKHELLNDVSSFFAKGVDVYNRLKLKPFRKLLLAGVPGTGKTMLCTALAKWALDRDYMVIYISSADANGSTFWKIQQALHVASTSKAPSIILLEEIDAYLHKHEKALVLNVLDGSESAVNEKGTLLIATTNYPEAIDERVLKRPGRLDRIFIIPETQTKEDAERLLRRYLGDMWKDGHESIASLLVGYPGAFIREVAVYALTHVAYEDLPDLPVDLLETSFNKLRDQIDVKDDFLQRRSEAVGFLRPNNNHN